MDYTSEKISEVRPVDENKVVLGLSGGVDSSVAALRLLEQGLQVYALYLDIGLGGEDAARDTARQLGIPFSTARVDVELERHVCSKFYEDYLAGRTPMPCARCNPTVKFPALLRHADAVGARYAATGHYARIGTGSDGKPVLLRGGHGNDQSYMLARLPRTMLERLLLPLGEVEKPQIRREAEEADLLTADRPDSMEICFIPDNDYAAWLDRRGGTPAPGNFVDTAGRILGTHKGFHHYTIGQRRGLGVSSTGRLFVSAIRPDKNEVVLSHGEGLHSDVVFCHELNWLAEGTLTAPIRGEVRLRHSRRADCALITPLEGGRVRLDMDAPARAPTPGQLAVFYDGDLVLGSGWIL